MTSGRGIPKKTGEKNKVFLGRWRESPQRVRSLSVTVGKAPVLFIYLCVPAWWVLGLQELSAERMFLEAGGANPTPVLGNIQQVGLENVLRAKQSFPCGSYAFHTKRAKTEGSGCPNEPWAVHCMPIWSLTRLLQQLYLCMRTCFLSRGVRAKRNKMQKKEDILPTQLCSLYHPWSLRGAVLQQFGLLLAQRGWSLPSVSPGIPSLGEIPCPVWPMEAPGGDQRAGGQESVSVFWVCF